MIKDYINTLKKQNKPLTNFDELMLESLLESATIIYKDTIITMLICFLIGLLMNFFLN